MNAKIKLQGIQQFVDVTANPNEDSFILNNERKENKGVNLDSPITGTVYGTLLNYKGALEKLGNEVNDAPYNQPPKAPILYIKPVNTHIGNDVNIPLPVDVPEVEIGACLGLVIGETATRVKEEEALNYVAGFTIVNDVSVPHESVYRPAISQKARDGFCPIGPWVLNKEQITNPNSLDVRVYLNGELVQENNTINLIRPISRLIADVTDFMTLSKGDVLLVGVPENAPKAKHGDRVRIEIEGIGSLENMVVKEGAE